MDVVVRGLVLAVPIMVSIKAAADHIDGLQPVGEILGRQPLKRTKAEVRSLWA
jgi:hypothetical protein